MSNLTEYQEMTLRIKTSFDKGNFEDNGIYTPVALVREILDNLDLSEGNILVISNIEFAVEMIYTYNVDPSRITLVAECGVKEKASNKLGIKYAYNQHGLYGMKFDIIVGNPPYQSASNTRKSFGFWKEFLQLSTEICDGTIALVIPGSFTSPAMFPKYKNRLTYISLDVKKYFPGVGSSFCYIILGDDDQEEMTVRTKDGEYTVNSKDHDCLPMNFSPELVERANKIFTNTRQWQKTNEHQTRITKEIIFNDDGKYDVIHSTVILKTDKYHPNLDKIRVHCSTTTYPIFHVIQGQGLTQAHVWTECNNMEEANELVEYLNSNEVQSVLREYNWSNMYYIQTIAQL